MKYCFNPHTHTGCDVVTRYVSRRSGSFNPHTHTGCDVGLYAINAASYSFNPHTHTGCDVGGIEHRPRQSVSIHTPIQGVTYDIYKSYYNFVVSIHTPIQGVTSISGRCNRIDLFQSTHPYRV